MRLRSIICEWTPSEPELLERLKLIYPSTIIDDNICNLHRPFIYAPQTKQKLYIGNQNGYHDGILGKLRPNNADDHEVIEVYHDMAAGIVGRIGHNIIALPKPNSDRLTDDVSGLSQASIAACYDYKFSSGKLAQEAAQLLLQQNLINSNTYIIYAGQVTQLGHNTQLQDATEEQQHLAKLQVALHLGAWPDGRRLTPEERRNIEDELGRPRNFAKHPWQAGMEKAGMINPGQRWWSPTSEGLTGGKSRAGKRRQ